MIRPVLVYHLCTRFLRALGFQLFFGFWFLFWALVSFPCALGPQRWLTHFCAPGWARGLRWALRFFHAITHHVEGLEHIPKTGPLIIAAKHQSTWETAMFHLYFPGSVFIIKRELTWIPLFGWECLRAGYIPVHRSNRNPSKIRAQKHLLKAVTSLFQNNGRLVIFPQGTRTIPGLQRPYRKGLGWVCASNLHVPVLPVALNAGQFWPRRGFFKKSGVIQMRILPCFMPSSDPLENIRRLEDAIEPVTRALENNAMPSQSQS